MPGSMSERYAVLRNALAAKRRKLEKQETQLQKASLSSEQNVKTMSPASPSPECEEQVPLSLFASQLFPTSPLHNDSDVDPSCRIYSLSPDLPESVRIVSVATVSESASSILVAILAVTGQVMLYSLQSDNISTRLYTKHHLDHKFDMPLAVHLISLPNAEIGIVLIYFGKRCVIVELLIARNVKNEHEWNKFAVQSSVLPFSELSHEVPASSFIESVQEGKEGFLLTVFLPSIHQCIQFQLPNLEKSIPICLDIPPYSISCKFFHLCPIYPASGDVLALGDAPLHVFQISFNQMLCKVFELNCISPEPDFRCIPSVGPIAIEVNSTSTLLSFLVKGSEGGVLLGLALIPASNVVFRRLAPQLAAASCWSLFLLPSNPLNQMVGRLAFPEKNAMSGFGELSLWSAAGSQREIAPLQQVLFECEQPSQNSVTFVKLNDCSNPIVVCGCNGILFKYLT